MPKKTKLKPVLNNDMPNAPSQFKVKESVEKESKIKDKDVFEGLKKKGKN